MIRNVCVSVCEWNRLCQRQKGRQFETSSVSFYLFIFAHEFSRYFWPIISYSICVYSIAKHIIFIEYHLVILFAKPWRSWNEPKNRKKERKNERTKDRVYLSSLVFDLLNCDATVLWVILRTTRTNRFLMIKRNKLCTYCVFGIHKTSRLLKEWSSNKKNRALITFVGANENFMA